MTTIFSRSALVYWGHNPAPNVHSVVDGRIVTWDEIMANRRVRQQERLRRIREATHEWRAYKLLVAYFDQDLMGGWHAFLYDLRGRHAYGTWINRDRRHMIPVLMRAIPLTLPLGTECEQWQRWMVAFSRRYQRRTQCGEPVGVLPIWWNQRDAPRVTLR